MAPLLCRQVTLVSIIDSCWVNRILGPQWLSNSAGDGSTFAELNTRPSLLRDIEAYVKMAKCRVGGHVCGSTSAASRSHCYLPIRSQEWTELLYLAWHPPTDTNWHFGWHCVSFVWYSLSVVWHIIWHIFWYWIWAIESDILPWHSIYIRS